MNSIILQPSSSKVAQEHYIDTIENPVTLESIKSFFRFKNIFNT